MTKDEMLSGTEIPTIEQLSALKADELREVAKEVFEAKDTENLNKKQLLFICNNMLEEFYLEESRNNIREFVKDQRNQERALKMAFNIRNGFGRNWFTLGELSRAYNTSIKESNKKLEDEEELHELSTVDSVKAEMETLKLFGLIKSQTSKKGKTKYKVVLGVVTKALRKQREKEMEIKRFEEI